ncbi:MAG: methylenetetrahydrofolate reductase [NAD(P)H] [Candidatus Margulisiibacteriota bacterium]
MKVSKDLNRTDRPTLSFEFFPPKTPEGEEHLIAAIKKLSQFNPDFVSVTYGAMGTTREKTFYWAEQIKKKFKIEPVAHLTCVGAERQDIAAQLKQLAKLGIENILALRGDPPSGETKFVPPKNGFRFASELVEFIKEEQPKFCVGVAGYPEKHTEASALKKDIANLKKKIDAGAEYVITQLFFNNQAYFDFVDQCRAAGIKVPIIPGQMMITSAKQIKTMTEKCGATIPKELLEKIEKNAENPDAIKRISTEWTLEQTRELIIGGVNYFHFFVMNQAEPISTVLSELGF